MAAYIIFDVEVTDPAAADDYLKLANESLTRFQSKTIVHGGMVEVLEGDWKPERVVVVEFESWSKLGSGTCRQHTPKQRIFCRGQRPSR